MNYGCSWRHNERDVEIRRNYTLFARLRSDVFMYYRPNVFFNTRIKRDKRDHSIVSARWDDCERTRQAPWSSWLSVNSILLNTCRCTGTLCRIIPRTRAEHDRISRWRVINTKNLNSTDLGVGVGVSGTEDRRPWYSRFPRGSGTRFATGRNAYIITWSRRSNNTSRAQ